MLLYKWEFVMAGKDKCVILWSIHDHIATSASDTGPKKSPASGSASVKPGSKSSGNNEKATESPSVGPRGIYQGHADTVEDVQFCPTR